MLSSLAHVLIVTPIIFIWLRERELRRNQARLQLCNHRRAYKRFQPHSKENFCEDFQCDRLTFILAVAGCRETKSISLT